MTDLVDDSIGFAALERDHIRRVVPHFDWLAFDTPSPRLPPAVPLVEARIGLISTAGAHQRDSRPMGPRGEVRNLPLHADVILTHPGYDTGRAGEDIDVVYPVASLRELAASGKIGSVGASVVSTMGFVPDGTTVLERLAPQAAACLRADQADLALLVPA